MAPVVPPRYRQVAEDLRREIQTGQIAPGRRLPSTRSLAQRLGISRFTVLAAYDVLVQEGYLVTRRGSGHFAALPAAEGRGPWNLLVGETEAQFFPAEVWSGLLQRHLRIGAASGTDPLGLPRLRTALATFLSRRLWRRPEPEQVVVTAGGQDALHLAARFLGRGVHGVEEPGYAVWRETLQVDGNRLLLLPADDEERFVAHLRQRQAPLRSLHLTADGQMPLGTMLSLEAREAVLGWAHRTGTPLLDDAYQELFLWQEPSPALWDLSAGQTVIRVGSFRRLLAPVVQLGYLLVPPEVTPVLARLRQLTGGGLPPAIQETLADFLEEGHLERLLIRARRAYEERGRALADALRRAGLAEARFPAAGLHLALPLPANAAAAILANRQVLCRPLSGGGLLLHFALLAPEEAGTVARMVADAAERPIPCGESAPDPGPVPFP